MFSKLSGFVMVESLSMIFQRNLAATENAARTVAFEQQVHSHTIHGMGVFTPPKFNIAPQK